MTEAIAALDNDDYREPSKMTVGGWLDIWSRDYLGDVKPYTIVDYTFNIRKHIKPALGAVKLDALTAHMIQQFYNNFVRPAEEGGKGLSPKTLRNVHLVLRRSLQPAVMLGYIRTNPAYPSPCREEGNQAAGRGRHGPLYPSHKGRPL